MDFDDFDNMEKVVPRLSIQLKFKPRSHISKKELPITVPITRTITMRAVYFIICHPIQRSQDNKSKEPRKIRFESPLALHVMQMVLINGNHYLLVMPQNLDALKEKQLNSMAFFIIIIRKHG